MALALLLMFSLMFLPVQTNGAESPAEAYWKSKLGNSTPMPKVVKDALMGSTNSESYKPNGFQNRYQIYAKEHSTGEANYKPNGFQNRYQIYAKEHPTGETNYKPNGFQNRYQIYSKEHPTSDINYKPNGFQNRYQIYAKEHLNSDTNYKPNGFQNRYQIYAKKHSTSDTNRLTDKSVLFFFEKELTHPKGKMMIRFITSDEEAKFLPIKVSKSIPFSSNKLQEILNLFSVQPGTTNAKIAEETITLCEAKAIKGEQKSCATSLEDMVDFAVAHVGNNVKVLSTEVNKEALVEYKVESANKIRNDRNVVCHKMGYPYAVFYCHTSEKTDAYIVSLMDANGKKLNAVAVCHKDTSSWSPNHMAFQVLNVKPGSVPICHFINEDTIMWVPNQTINN